MPSAAFASVSASSGREGQRTGDVDGAGDFDGGGNEDGVRWEADAGRVQQQVKRERRRPRYIRWRGAAALPDHIGGERDETQRPHGIEKFNACVGIRAKDRSLHENRLFLVLR